VRRQLPLGLLNLFSPFLFFLILIQGCSSPFLQTYAADEKDSEIVLAAFSRFQQNNTALCKCCLDAEADIIISVSGWFHEQTGKFSGYLQAMKPGYVRFVALNPLGQPWYILITDGETFKSLNVFEEKAYQGSVHSKTYNKISPAGFEPGFSYYWLTGTLQPGDMDIQAVMRDRTAQEAYWLQVKHANESTESMILFDPVRMLILRHVLRSERGEYLAEVTYEDYQPLTGGEQHDFLQNSPKDVSNGKTGEYCRFPGRVTVTSQRGSEKIEVKLHSFIAEAHFSPTDFTLEIPENFEQLFVR
jgi:hypothetical protein